VLVFCKNLSFVSSSISGSLIIIYSSQFHSDIETLLTNINGVFDSIPALQNQISGGATNVTTIIDGYINNLAPTVVNIDFYNTIDTNLGPTIRTIFNSMLTIGTSLASIATGVTNTQAAINSMSASVRNISNTVALVQGLLTNASTVSFDGATYNINGLPTIPSTSLSDPASSINFNSITSSLSSVPNIPNLVSSVNATYYDAITGIKPTINSTIRSLTGSITTMPAYSSFKTSLSSSLSGALDSPAQSVAGIKKNITDIGIAQYVYYLSLGLIVIAGIVMLAYSFGFLGVIFQKGVVIEM
jgi:hypothetical protein